VSRLVDIVQFNVTGDPAILMSEEGNVLDIWIAAGVTVNVYVLELGL
jgi:hypothetical protein